MITLEEVAELARSLPEVTEGSRYSNRTWFVRKKGFVWERPLSKADLARYGDETPPDGPIIGVRVDDLTEKDVVLSSGQKGFFTIPHFDGYAAVLIQLRVATKRSVREAIVDAWLACAPKKLADQYLADEQRS